MKMGVGGRRVGREREERGRKEKIRKKGKEEKKYGCPVNLNIRSIIIF